jgi:catechol 2,3-dioxygenase-like lactoylglutathione lyase family enzyme
MIEEFHHVAIGVSDLDKAVDFYTETLGMELDYSAHHIGAIVELSRRTGSDLS